MLNDLNFWLRDVSRDPIKANKHIKTVRKRRIPPKSAQKYLIMLIPNPKNELKPKAQWPVCGREHAEQSWAYPKQVEPVWSV